MASWTPVMQIQIRYRSNTAVATNDLGVLRLFFELRASGYDGSTYTLTYDAANDQLKGIYDQVVAKQKFEVTFVRAKPR